MTRWKWYFKVYLIESFGKMALEIRNNSEAYKKDQMWERLIMLI